MHYNYCSTSSSLRTVLLLLASTPLFSKAFVMQTDRVSSIRSTQRNTHPLFLAPQQLGSFDELLSGEQKHADSLQQDQRRVALYDWSTEDPIAFTEAWDWQKDIVESQLERLGDGHPSASFLQQSSSSSSSAGVDTVILLQHEPVYTLGTASDPSFIRNRQHQQDDVQIVRMDRGGEVTYHGPGQLVVYPILDLRCYRQDIHWYMRALEEVVLRALRKTGIANAVRQDDVTGVWVDDHKVAAIGIKARRWVTMHGLAINVDETSLENFEGIVPCGLEGRRVGCVNQFLDEPVSMEAFVVHVKAAIEEVFCIRLDRVE